MHKENLTTQGEELLSYVVASGDMRFIEIGERSLFLRHDPELGQVIRGEVPESRPESYANLSQVLLEYVMGCRDCREANMTAEAADRFGRRLGRKLIEHKYQEPVGQPGTEALGDAMTIILNSMEAPYEVERSSSRLLFTLAYCPLHATANRVGLALWVASAHRALISLIETLLPDIAPGWSLKKPAERETEAPLQEILFVRL